MTMKTKATKAVPVLVTTEYRGVFCGLLDPAERTERTVRLADARMAIYWGTTGGVAELAASGPTSKSKIGSRAGAVVLHGVTAIFDVTPAAWVAWCSR